LVETELKIALDESQEARLRRHPDLAALRVGNRRNQTLVSVYYDTPGHELAAAGIALRLRKVGRRWVQTVKFGKGSGNGLFARKEIEFPAPGGRLVLDGPDPEGLFAKIRRIAGAAALSPVFETRIRRITDHLKLESGSEVELALDHGEVVAGEAREPIHEAEIELVSGEVGAVYDIAQLLFKTGPVRFAQESKAALGYRVARGETGQKLRPRNAGAPDYSAEATVESVARDVFHDCFVQIATNMQVVADSDEIEGPHQLRVGLRRIRTAFSAFGVSLGKEAFEDLSARARGLGQVVGGLRDMDVLIDEMVRGRTEGLDADATEALLAALEERRATIRKEVRMWLASSESIAFLFDLGRLIERRGWLTATDYSQTERLAAPVSEVSASLLQKRYKKVIRTGHGIRKLDTEALHELRKDLKKLRYTAEVFGTIYPGKKVKAYVKSLKALQEQFGSLNDAAMTAGYLTGPEAKGRKDPAAQRAVGWILGTLSVQVRDDRPKLYDCWDAFEAQKTFWA
jgi:triphosphatase